MVWPAAGLGAMSVAAHAWDILKEVAIIFITSTIVWPQVNSRENSSVATGLGKQILGGQKKTKSCVHQDPEERSNDPT